jgi:two-component system sensor histidine kinase PhoQ
MGGSGATLIDLAVLAPLEQLQSALAKVYADKRVTVTLDVAPGTAYPIDAGDFLELAGNLMDNAFKYGKSAVAVRAAPWTAAGWRRPGLVLEVEDDGSGIPASERARVLERGARADESVAGQGIGLAAARDRGGLRRRARNRRKPPGWRAARRPAARPLNGQLTSNLMPCASGRSLE